MKHLTKSKVIGKVLENVREDMKNEDIIHLVLESQVSQESCEESATFGQKVADKLAKIAGSWAFIIVFLIILISWMTYNIIQKESFDPYPFILLNLFLSCVASVQAPIIMMSQNRQTEKDRIHAENVYKVNLKTEIIIQDLHNKLDQILENQEMLIQKDKD